MDRPRNRALEGNTGRVGWYEKKKKRKEGDSENRGRRRLMGKQIRKERSEQNDR